MNRSNEKRGYRFKDEMTTEELLSILRRTASHIKFDCEEWRRGENSVSFKLGFPIDFIRDIHDPKIWSMGATIRRFRFPKKQNFLAEGQTEIKNQMERTDRRILTSST
ncbi:hypothetical protein JTB14_001700 [Gonioctena quinquepunctata]|nr:hypothetical protein JTB14_001700 [Gonioctena quinquepunctata]